MNPKYRLKVDPFRLGDCIVDPRTGEFDTVIRIDRGSRVLVFSKNSAKIEWSRCMPPTVWAEADGSHGKIAYR